MRRVAGAVVSTGLLLTGCSAIHESGPDSDVFDGPVWSDKGWGEHRKADGKPDIGKFTVSVVCPEGGDTKAFVSIQEYVGSIGGGRDKAATLKGADVNGDGVVAPEEVASTYPSHLVQMSCRTATGRKGPLAVGVNMKKYEMLEQYTSTVAVGMVTVRCEIAQSGVNKIGRHGDFAAVVSPDRPKSEVNVAGCYDDGVQATVQHPGK